jgi:hypothetical protein
MVTKQDEPKTAQTTAESIARAGAGKPAAPPAGTFRYIDRPDCMETFADCITGLAYDGQTLRLEFGVTRVDEVKPNAPVNGRRYTACRLALSPAAAIDLINKMQQIANALTQAGVVKQTAPVPPTERA